MEKSTDTRTLQYFSRGARSRSGPAGRSARPSGPRWVHGTAQGRHRCPCRPWPPGPPRVLRLRKNRGARPHGVGNRQLVCGLQLSIGGRPRFHLTTPCLAASRPVSSTSGGWSGAWRWPFLAAVRDAAPEVTSPRLWRWAVRSSRRRRGHHGLEDPPVLEVVGLEEISELAERPAARVSGERSIEGLSASEESSRGASHLSGCSLFLWPSLGEHPVNGTLG